MTTRDLRSSIRKDALVLPARGTSRCPDRRAQRLIDRPDSGHRASPVQLPHTRWGESNRKAAYGSTTQGYLPKRPSPGSPAVFECLSSASAEESARLQARRSLERVDIGLRPKH